MRIGKLYVIKLTHELLLKPHYLAKCHVQFQELSQGPDKIALLRKYRTKKAAREWIITHMADIHRAWPSASFEIMQAVRTEYKSRIVKSEEVL